MPTSIQDHADEAHDDAALEQRIANWLRGQGYPLEMTVASVFQRAGFRIFQSDYFYDEESGGYREVDVVADLQARVENVVLRVRFVTECKLSRGKPWVLFTSRGPLLSDRARVAQRAASRIGYRLLRLLARSEEVQRSHLFQLPDRCAYGMTQAFTTGADVSFAAAMSVSKAADAHGKEATDASRTQGNFCEIIFPIIVIDGKLFECYLDEECRQVLTEVGRGVLVWRNQMVGVPHTIIQLVTAGALDDFVADMKQSAEELLALAAREIQAMDEASRIRALGLHARRS